MDLLRSGMPFSLSRLQQEPSTAHHPSEEGCWWHLKLYWNVCPMARCLTTVTECQKLPSPLLCPDVLLGGLGPPQWNATVCCTLKAYGASACLKHHSACLWAHNSVLHLVFQDFCFHAAVMCQVFRQWYLGCTGGGNLQEAVFSWPHRKFYLNYALGDDPCVSAENWCMACP